MSTRYFSIGSALTLIVALAAAAAAQQPRIINARVSPHPSGGDLQQAFRALVQAQAETAWIGYSVPSADPNRVTCCWTHGDGTTYFSGTISGNAPCCGACRIEPSTTGARTEPAAKGADGPIRLEGSTRLVVLFRVVDRAVERIRAFSEDCELDAGGRQVHWLTDVRPSDSIALLASFVGAENGRRNRKTGAALSAITMHADPAAATAVERLARSHESASVRGEAIFWLSQMAGARVAATITDAIANDPETEVKKRAVFALSQLPRDEGVPLLIDVARRNPNPVVKKQAIFWLGQSKDPRALDFFAQILK